jgi:hypothetical protein
MSQSVAMLDRLVGHVHGKVAKLMGVQPPPLVWSTEVPNAASNGLAVFVNPYWLADTLVRFCSDHVCATAVVFGVLAHENSHHVYGDALCSGCQRQAQELRADYEAGRVLYRAGMSAKHFQCVIAELNLAGRDYPSTEARIRTIQRGYNDASRPAPTSSGSGGGWAIGLAALLAFIAVAAASSSKKKHR